MEILGSIPDVVKFIVVFLLILGALAPVVWRWFNFGSLRHGHLRGRRLSVVETTAVDVRHRLVLVKRDNVEHLLLVGSTTNIVVESNIARPQPVAREPRPIPDARPEASRQQPAVAETPDWTMPPEPMARPVRTVDLDAALPEPPARTAREAMVDSMRAVRSVAAARRGPPMDLDNPPEEIAAPTLTPPSPADINNRSAPEPRRATAEPQRPQPAPVSALNEAPPEPKRERTLPPPRPVQLAPTAAPNGPRPAQPTPAAASAGPAQPARPTPADEGNFAEMAQRLEAALRRPNPAKPEAPSSIRQPRRPEQPAGRRPATADGTAAAKAAKSPDAPPPDLKVMQGKGKNEAAMDSLEDEMARMLGRPGKS